MTATDWQKLKQDAAETIAGIDLEKLNEKGFILYGASLAILDHSEPGAAPMPAPPEKPVQPFVARHTHVPLMELVEDELSDAEKYFSMNEIDIAQDELRHADRFLNVLRAQGDKRVLQELIERRDAIAARL